MNSLLLNLLCVWILSEFQTCSVARMLMHYRLWFEILMVRIPGTLGGNLFLVFKD